MTIVEAIIRVLKDEGPPLSHLMIYKLINERYYYDFGAKDPKSVVRGKIRKHCQGVEFATASPKKYFVEVRRSSHKRKPIYAMWEPRSRHTPSRSG